MTLLVFANPKASIRPSIILEVKCSGKRKAERGWNDVTVMKVCVSVFHIMRLRTVTTVDRHPSLSCRLTKSIFSPQLCPKNTLIHLNLICIFFFQRYISLPVSVSSFSSLSLSYSFSFSRCYGIQIMSSVVDCSTLITAGHRANKPPPILDNCERIIVRAEHQR